MNDTQQGRLTSSGIPIHSSSSIPFHSPSSPSSDMGRICLLVFTDDFVCRNLVSEVLQHCSYEVLHIGRATDALGEIGKRRNGISFVLTNLNRLKTNGAEIIQTIEKELNLGVCLILPPSMEFDTKGQECNVSSYILNFSDIREMKALWQSAFEKEKVRKPSAIRSPVMGVEIRIENNNEPSVDGEPGNYNDHHNRRAKEVREKPNEESGGEKKKKPRLSWNPEMHQRFEQAINKLGIDKAVPKKIVELMNEPGLTREHVASHLQLDLDETFIGKSLEGSE
ncbi:PREDICTED: two-component response regulator ARR2-like [Ipomoea nil]|uniref:two-component response regulator ARR2-like n=1 Tax=Ipomoea nil TaxID=35883 RepID=UPI000900B28B|nr:PREDICTED: two-component response regulator ARR2-like [Ipomoea nil]